MDTNGVPEPREVGQKDEVRLEGRENGGWHQNWFALARSSELGPEQAIARDVLGGRILAWRTKSGKLVVSSPWCQHLGADLSVGKVVGEKILCAFHHWEYGSDGCGIRNYFGEELPKTARLRVFPCVERYGLIWFFNGETALFDPPAFDFPEEQLVYDVYDSPVFPQPPWVMLTNSHDYQHLRILHEMKLTSGPSNLKLGAHVREHDARFELNGMSMDLHVSVPGTNTIVLSARMGGDEGAWMLNMYTGLPRPNGSTTGYSISASALPPNPDDEARERARSMVEMGKAWGESLLADDSPIMMTLSFKDANLLEVDHELRTFFEWVRRYPKADLV